MALLIDHEVAVIEFLKVFVFIDTTGACLPDTGRDRIALEEHSVDIAVSILEAIKNGVQTSGFFIEYVVLFLHAIEFGTEDLLFR